jgi:N-acetylmuramate 1-kinase
VTHLFERIPIPVPRIIDEAADLGILALEDLGDVTLQAHLGVASPGEMEALYAQAVDYLITLQRRGSELEDASYLPYTLAFDEDKLTWEMHFFVRYFLEAYRGIEMSAAVGQGLTAELAAIVRELAAEPRVLCHRDYHSRNLMLHDGQLYIIDFQDARMGPDTYDLVSLLRDSYVDLPEHTVAELIAYFLALKGQNDAEPAFRSRFALMALQRNLKALGTFGFQTTARRNPVYIQYIPRTLRYVRDNLQQLPALGRLHELLAAHVEEFR